MRSLLILLRTIKQKAKEKRGQWIAQKCVGGSMRALLSGYGKGFGRTDC